MLGNERQNGNLCETSVVKFGRSLPLHGLVANAREVDRGEDHGGVLPALHVVRSLVSLGDQLGDEDCEKDLRLTGGGDGGPRVGGAHRRERLEANIAGKHSREVNSSLIDKVSRGCNL